MTRQLSTNDVTVGKEALWARWKSKVDARRIRIRMEDHQQQQSLKIPCGYLILCRLIKITKRKRNLTSLILSILWLELKGLNFPDNFPGVLFMSVWWEMFISFIDTYLERS